MDILVMLVFAILGLVLFWGVVIYFIVKLFRSNSGLSTQQKIDLVSKGLRAYSGRGSSGDLMDTKVGSVAASEGIDLNRDR